MKHLFKVVLAFSLLTSFEYAFAQDHSPTHNLITAGEFFSALARQKNEPFSIDSLDQQQTIMGRKTLRSVRYQLQKSTVAIYEMFNEVNSSAEMDVICKHVEIGRNFRFSTSLICEPAFMERLRRENEENQALRAEKMPRAISWLIRPRKLTEEQLRESASDLFYNLESEMNELVIGSQLMQAQLNLINELQVEYESMLKENARLRQGPFFFEDAPELLENSYLDIPPIYSQPDPTR